MVVRFVAFPGTPFASPYHYMVFLRGHDPLTARLLKPVLVDAETAHVTETRNLPWYLTAFEPHETSCLLRKSRVQRQPAVPASLPGPFA